MLIGLLGCHFEHFSDHLRNLIELLIKPSVQVHASSRRLGIDSENYLTQWVLLLLELVRKAFSQSSQPATENYKHLPLPST